MRDLAWARRAKCHVSLIKFFLPARFPLAGHGHFARLAHAKSRMAAAVANDYQRGETEVLAPFHDFVTRLMAITSSFSPKDSLLGAGVPLDCLAEFAST